MESKQSIHSGKVWFYENTENIVNVLEARRRESVSFYEGIAVFLSEGFMESDLNTEGSFDYPAQQAA